MKGWVICKKENISSYDNQHLLEAAKIMEIDIEFHDSNEFDIIEGDVLHNGQKIVYPDFVLPRMGSATTYFTLALLRQLERLGILVINNSASIEKSKDKFRTAQILSTHNLPTPKTMLARFPIDINIIVKELNLPVVVKTLSGSEGKGVFLCESKVRLEDLADILNESKGTDVHFIVQEFISTSRGKDIRVVVIGGKPVVAMLRTGKRGRFKANISLGGSGKPYDIPSAVEYLSVEAARVFGLDVAGVDILFDNKQFKVCEINSSPGFSGIEKATGVNMAEQILQYVKIRLEMRG